MSYFLQVHSSEISALSAFRSDRYHDASPGLSIVDLDPQRVKLSTYSLQYVYTLAWYGNMAFCLAVCKGRASIIIVLSENNSEAISSLMIDLSLVTLVILK